MVIKKISKQVMKMWAITFILAIQVALGSFKNVVSRGCTSIGDLAHSSSAWGVLYLVALIRQVIEPTIS